MKLIFEELKEDWKYIKYNTRAKFSESMPMAAVIKNKGEPTKYFYTVSNVYHFL